MTRSCTLSGASKLAHGGVEQYRCVFFTLIYVPAWANQVIRIPSSLLPDLGMRHSSWRHWAEKGKEFIEEEIPKEVPKPYTVPEGWVPPTLGEQFRYAAIRHPYARWGWLLRISSCINP
jgi:hypothetical protein